MLNFAVNLLILIVVQVVGWTEGLPLVYNSLTIFAILDSD